MATFCRHFFVLQSKSQGATASFAQVSTAVRCLSWHRIRKKRALIMPRKSQKATKSEVPCLADQHQSVGYITHSSGRPTLQCTARTNVPMQAHDKTRVIRAACHAIGVALFACPRLRDTLGTGWKIVSITGPRAGSSSWSWSNLLTERVRD